MAPPGSDVLRPARPSLRQVARRFATGVTVVAVNGDRGAHALTANSFVTLSLKPPLVAIAIRTDGRFRPLVERVGWFGVSILAASQRRYAIYYANRDRTGPAEARLTAAGSPVAVPVVPGCLGYFVCAVESIRPVGDHDLIVGEVGACESSDDPAEPLVFFNSRYRG